MKSVQPSFSTKASQSLILLWHKSAFLPYLLRLLILQTRIAHRGNDTTAIVNKQQTISHSILEQDHMYVSGVLVFTRKTDKIYKNSTASFKLQSVVKLHCTARMNMMSRRSTVMTSPCFLHTLLSLDSPGTSSGVPCGKNTKRWISVVLWKKWKKRKKRKHKKPLSAEETSRLTDLLGGSITICGESRCSSDSPPSMLNLTGFELSLSALDNLGCFSVAFFLSNKANKAVIRSDQTINHVSTPGRQLLSEEKSVVTQVGQMYFGLKQSICFCFFRSFIACRFFDVLVGK